MSCQIKDFEETSAILNNKKVTLLGATDSPVASLFTSLYGVIGSEVDDQTIALDVNKSLANTTYSNLLNAASTNYADMISYKLEYTKSVAVSVFNYDAEQLIERLAKIKTYINSNIDIQIDYFKPSEIMSDADFIESLEKSKTIGSGDESKWFDLPVVDEPYVYSLLEKNPMFVKYKSELNGNLTDAFYASVNSSNIKGGNNYSSKYQTIVDRILTLLIIDTLLNYVDPLEDVNVSFKEYQTQLVNVRRNLASNVLTDISVLKSLMNKEYVIVGASKNEEGKITLQVNEINFNDLSELNPNITVETVYGAGLQCLEDGTYVTIKNIVENSEKFLKQYETYINVRKASSSNKFLNNAKDEVKKILKISLSEVTEKELNAYYLYLYPSVDVISIDKDIKLNVWNKHAEKITTIIDDLVRQSVITDYDNVYKLLEPVYVQRFSYLDFQNYIDCYNAAKNYAKDEQSITNVAVILYTVNYILNEVDVYSLNTPS